MDPPRHVIFVRVPLLESLRVNDRIHAALPPLQELLGLLAPQRRVAGRGPRAVDLPALTEQAVLNVHMRAVDALALLNLRLHCLTDVLRGRAAYRRQNLLPALEGGDSCRVHVRLHCDDLGLIDDGVDVDRFILQYR